MLIVSWAIWWLYADSKLGYLVAVCWQLVGLSGGCMLMVSWAIWWLYDDS